MAARPPNDGSRGGSAHSSKKRAGDDDGEKQKRLKRSSWNPFASSTAVEEFNPSDTEGERTPSPKPPTAEEREEHQRRIARAVDDAHAALNAERIRKEIKDTNDPFDPDILPVNPAWIGKREEVKKLLQIEGKSLLSVLETFGIQDNNFKALLLLPPKTDDKVLAIQMDHAKLYKEALGPGGAFEGTNDNLVTKIAMLYFGLPVEPVTYKNIMNCENDQNDGPDDPLEDPKVQRIMYSEKALEFLDSYHERSFGFPCLRRPKSLPQKTYEPVVARSNSPGNDSDSDDSDHHTYGLKPLKPTGDALEMRGGGGELSDRYLYNRYGASIRLTAVDHIVSEDEFLAAALKALDLDPESHWSFVVDQWNNDDRYKTAIYKPFVASFPVDHLTFEKIYERNLKARVSHREHNWAMSVDYPRVGKRPANEEFRIPKRPASGEDILDLAKLPKDRPRGPRNANTATTQPAAAPISSTPRTVQLYSHPGGRSQAFEDGVEQFGNAISNLYPSGVPTKMSVSLYLAQDNSPPGTGSKHEKTVLFPMTNNLFVNREIRKCLFKQSGWTAVVHQTNIMAPAFWPPSSAKPAQEMQSTKPALTTAYLFRKDQSVQDDPASADFRNKDQSLKVGPTSAEFKNAALKLLGIKVTSHNWEFDVDFYRNRTGSLDKHSRARDFAHTRRNFKPATLGALFERDVKPRLFDSDWTLVVRHPYEDDAPSFNPSHARPLFSLPPTPAKTPAVTFAQGSHAAQPKKTESVRPSGPPVLSTGPSYIYGYGGRIKVDKTVASFQAGALALLGLVKVGGWTFTVDLHHTTPPTSIALSAGTIAARFPKIKNVPGHPAHPWPVFVRKSSKVSTKDLTPPANLNNYVTLNGPIVASYWKLPTSLKDKYGMNQIQDSFFSAMLVHYPLGTLRPAQNVQITTDLGYGGMEITEEFWEDIVREAESSSAHVVVKTGIPQASTEIGEEMGIRIAGSHKYRTFKRGDFEELAQGIRELSQSEVFDRATNLTSTRPLRFTAWLSAEERENGVSHYTDHRAFYYNDDEGMPNQNGRGLVDALRHWFAFDHDHGKKRTNCIWFRPSWSKFTVVDNSPTDHGGMQIERANQTWAAMFDATLESFRTTLGLLWDDNDREFTDNFEIHIPQGNQRFVINNQTTEDQWRKHVFDCFHDDTLIVQKSDGVNYERDTSDPWGIVDVPSSKKTVTFRFNTDPDAPRRGRRSPLPDDQAGHSHDHGHDDRSTRYNESHDNSRSNHKGNGHRGGPPHVAQPAHKPRRIPGAKPPIFRTSEVPKWDTWMLDHTAQNTLQQRSWSQDQSVIEPGYAPAAPMYGDNLELAITVGSSMPTVFTQHLTPTDIMELRKENRKLLNHALEREIGCPICNMTFKPYDKDAKSAHYKTHMEQINAAGNCPICNENWALFTWTQKRDHLYADFAKKEREEIKQFWEDARCPICDLELNGLSAEAVTTHMASHVPGALKFCDRCGLDLLKCTPIERSHHDRVCTRETPVRQDGAPDPVFCENCGRERTAATEKSREHETCGNGQYCVRCGLNLSFLPGPQERHAHTKRCRFAGGTTGTYCKRCGIHLPSLDDLGKASHDNECYRREPASEAADDTYGSATSQAVEAQRIKNASERADLLRRQTEVAAQEIAISARERDVIRRERNQNRLNDPLTGTASCYICNQDLSKYDREDIISHFQDEHGSDLDGGNKSTFQRQEDGLPSCHSDALNASLAEFKRRLPDFREAHSILQQAVDGTKSVGTVYKQPPEPSGAQKAVEKRHRDEPERLAIQKAEITLGQVDQIPRKWAKRGLENQVAKDAREAVKKQGGELIELRAAFAELQEAHPVTDGKRLSALDRAKFEEAQTRVKDAEEAHKKAIEDENVRSAGIAVKHSVIAADIAARKLVIGLPSGPNDSSGGPGGGGGAGGGGGGGDGGGTPGPNDQIGFLPSPPHPSFKNLPTPRRARSVKGRAPATGSKRKKAAMDDSEDTMSGGFSNLVRSPSKRETKKMRTTGGERIGSSPQMMRRRMMIAEEGEGDEEGSIFDGGEVGIGIGGVERRATRAMSGTPSVNAREVISVRKVGRPRKVVQEEVAEDDGFEDVEEGDEEDDDGGEMPAMGTLKRARK
ncbi:hypothetical protein VTL71DRAFT_7441 [Oculimacula yallundae]|uniref:C2H2-type domain-containing protein n=1 Tax=Oculimacula yallundae TaxID=86028 RepID=A0ABR4BU52_9HELO